MINRLLSRLPRLHGLGMTGLELGGFVAIVVGLGLIYWPLGLIVGGGLLVLAAQRPRKGSKQE